MGLTTAPTLVLGLLVIICIGRILGAAARRLGQPEVVGEIAGGILLGPTIANGVISDTLFPTGVRSTLGGLANVGVCLFVFLVGSHLNVGRLRGQGRLITTVSVGALVVPFGMGALVAGYYFREQSPTHRAAFVIFMGTAMSVTALPVLARMLTDRGIVRTHLGVLALACAAVDDVLAWALLALAVALVDAATTPWRAALAVPYLALMLVGVRPLLARLAERGPPASRLACAQLATYIAVGLVLSTAATAWMGLHTVSGAFLFGIVTPQKGLGGVSRYTQRLCSTVLLPVFFVVSGWHVDLSLMDWSQIGNLALILTVAIGGKFVGVLIGTRIHAMHFRFCAALATLMNVRGLTEVIVLRIGLQTGLLNSQLFSTFVLMTLLTTLMAGGVLRLTSPEWRAGHDGANPRDLVSTERRRARACQSSNLSREPTSTRPESVPQPGRRSRLPADPSR